MKRQILFFIHVLLLALVSNNANALTGSRNSSTLTVTITGLGTTEGSDIIIPETTTFSNIGDDNTYTVTAIAASAFQGTDITSIKIPKTVTSIGDYAFADCANLKKVIIADGTTAIEFGQNAFAGCNNLTDVYNGAFVDLGWSASGVTMHVYSENLAAAKENSEWSNYNITDDFCNPKAGYLATIVGTGAKALKVSGDLNGTDIKYLRKLMTDYSLAKLDLSDANIVAGGEAYYSSYYTTDNTIGERMFNMCSKIQELILPKSVTTIDKYTFRQCDALKKITIYAGTNNISYGIFLYSYGLESVEIEATNDSYTVVDNIIYTKDMKEVVACVPAKTGVVELPNTVTTLRNRAFLCCQNISTLVLPASLTKINELAFNYCGIKEVISNAIVPPVADYQAQQTQSIPLDAIIRVPTESIESYKTANFWKDYVIDSRANVTKMYYWTNGTPEKSTDGYSQLTYADGAKLMLVGNKEKSYSTNDTEDVIINGVKPVKLSNGAQNKFVAPEGFYVNSITIYSVVNESADSKDPARLYYWKEVNGVPYTVGGTETTYATTEHKSMQDFENPDVATFELGGVSSFTFNNYGKQSYIVLKIQYTADAPILPTQIQLNKNTIAQLGEDATETLTATLIPEGQVTNTQVLWTSSNNNIATVNKDGVITGKAKGTAFITATSVADKSITATCKVNVCNGKYVLVDGTPYTNETDKQYDEIEYTRSFTRANTWNALYLPISFNVEDYADKFEIAEIYAFCVLEDTNGDGEYNTEDENKLIVNPVKYGVTMPNTPYLIRPKNIGEQVIKSHDGVLYAAEDGYVDCSTTKMYYKISGLNEPVVCTANDGNWYMTASGTFSHITVAGKTTTVKPNRWILTMTPRNDRYKSQLANMSKEINIVLIGEEETTGVTDVNSEQNVFDNGVIHTIEGMTIGNVKSLPAGLYIKNGKKYLVK